MSHMRLPQTLEEVGLDDQDLKVFYRKLSDYEYIVWFGITLGESETYHYTTKKWD